MLQKQKLSQLIDNTLKDTKPHTDDKRRPLIGARRGDPHTHLALTALGLHVVTWLRSHATTKGSRHRSRRDRTLENMVSWTASAKFTHTTRSPPHRPLLHDYAMHHTGCRPAPQRVAAARRRVPGNLNPSYPGCHVERRRETTSSGRRPPQCCRLNMRIA